MLEKIFLQTFIVFAVWAAMWEGMIFEDVRDQIRQRLTGLSEKLKMVLYECPICMNSVYGSAFYWLYYGNSVKEYIVVLIACVGLSAIFVKLFPPDEN